MRKKWICFGLMICVGTTVLMGCTKKEGNKESGKENELTGTITVLTNKTDAVDNTFKVYAEKFCEKYPGAEVKFEVMMDYQGDVTTRLSTQDYGDALLIPQNIAKSEIPDFFEPLGDYDEISETYRFIDPYTIDGQVYGIPTGGNVEGIIYNAKVFKEAGITTQPKTIEEFMNALRAIQDNTEAIPMHTNYADTWPLYPWVRELASVSYYGTGEWAEAILEAGSPFDPKTGFAYTSLELLYNAVKAGLCEEDPTTGEWESSKQMMADNKVGCMVLGSWAISQIQEYSDTPEDIKFMPFPIEVNGELHVSTTPDWMYGVSKYSENKELAKAWCHFFAAESGYIEDEGFISPLISAEFPDYFDEDTEYTLVDCVFPEGEKAEKFDNIQNDSLISLYDQSWIKKVVEIGMGNSDETFEGYMDSLDQRWKKAAK